MPYLVSPCLGEMVSQPPYFGFPTDGVVAWVAEVVGAVGLVGVVGLIEVVDVVGAA